MMEQQNFPGMLRVFRLEAVLGWVFKRTHDHGVVFDDLVMNVIEMLEMGLIATWALIIWFKNVHN